MDAKLDATGDLDISTGDIQLLDDADAIAQHMSIRFKFNLGEWFLDLLEGVPYVQKILVKTPKTSVVRSIFRKVAERTPGVSKVNTLNLDFNRETRNLEVGLSGETNTGEPLNYEERFLI